MAKKKIYISAFIVLGILLQFLAHALIEIWYIELLVSNFPKYGLGFSWDFWLRVHEIWSVVFLIGGVLLGYSQGKYWWRKIYEEKLLEKKFHRI